MLAARSNTIVGGGSAGRIVRMTGYSGTNDPTQIEIFQGTSTTSMRCSVTPDIQQTPDNLIFQFAVWNCSAGESTAGYYNFSYYANDPYSGYGLGIMTRRTVRVTPDANTLPYSYAAVPNIDAISFNASGVGGGSVLTITGRCRVACSSSCACMCIYEN